MNKSRLISLFCQGLILICSLISASAQTAVAAQDAGSQEKQRRAEQVVIRALGKFGQTLNFDNVYRETFVNDKTTRSNVVDPYLKDLFDDATFRNLSRKALENLSIKINNIAWLMILGKFNEEKESHDIEQALLQKFSRRQRILYKHIMESSGTESSNYDRSLLASKTQFLNALSICDIALIVLRKRFVFRVRRNIQNEIAINSSEFFNEPPNEKLKRYKSHYEVTIKKSGKEMNIVFIVVEDAGSMKILSVDPTDD